jgi:hypothetical protein
MDELPGSFGTEQQHGAGGASTIEVDNITKLINALNRATAGVTIRLERGERVQGRRASLVPTALQAAPSRSHRGSRNARFGPL